MDIEIKWKKFISVYGIKFVGLYILAFVLLVTLFGRYEFKTFRGDLLIRGEESVLYLPFTSALAFAVFFLIIFEIYKKIK